MLLVSCCVFVLQSNNISWDITLQTFFVLDVVCFFVPNIMLAGCATRHIYS